MVEHSRAAAEVVQVGDVSVVLPDEALPEGDAERLAAEVVGPK